MARTRVNLRQLSEADRIQPPRRTQAVKQPGLSGRFGRQSVGGKTPAHLHQYTGTAPGGLGKSFYPRADPPHCSRRKRKNLLSLPPLKGPKPHNRVAHEIRHYQRTTHLLIARAPFEDLIRYIAYKVTEAPEFSNWDSTNVRFTPQAMQAIQEAAEYQLIKIFRNSCRLTALAKRKTLKPIDFRLAVDLRDPTI